MLIPFLHCNSCVLISDTEGDNFRADVPETFENRSKQCLLVYYGFQVLIWMGMSRLLNPNCGSHLVIFVFNESIEA